MIDEDIEKHLRGIVEDAYPNVEEDQILVLFPSATVSYSVANLKRCAEGIPIAYETIHCRLTISHELKLDREEVVRRLQRKHITLNGSSLFQEVKRVMHTDNVEVINFKGILFEIDYGHKIFKV